MWRLCGSHICMAKCPTATLDAPAPILPVSATKHQMPTKTVVLIPIAEVAGSFVPGPTYEIATTAKARELAEKLVGRYVGVVAYGWEANSDADGADVLFKIGQVPSEFG